MAQLEPQTPNPTGQTDHNEVVYRRAPRQGDEERPPGPTMRARARELAPALTPLIIGFTLLLVLISVLGYWSVRRMDDVNFQARDIELQHSARVSLLLNLRLALTKLDNEARARHDAEARREWKPPFEVRLSTARDDLKKLLVQMDKPPLSEDPSWRPFREDLKSYVDITEDLRRYSL